MGLSEDGEDTIKRRFDELCLDLNMDRTAQDDAWTSYERISTNYTLEGDRIHWLACALYVACRNTIVPTVGSGDVEGNFVSLTRLLRSTKLSLLEFFKKIRKWANMANLPVELSGKVDKLERNFAVSSVIFRKFGPIFLDIFRNPKDEAPKPPRGRKQKRLPCSLTEVFNFAWTMYVQVKGNFRQVGDDLVNSYHLLLCCIDWVYVNALLSNRRDLLNPQFSGLPENFESKEFKPPTDVPCIIQLLSDKHDGLLIEAKGIKEHWWKPYLKKLFDKKVLRGKAENLTGILEIGGFEQNSKAITKLYEEYVLNVGDFDERVFLDPNADNEIGTPAKPGHGPFAPGELQDQIMKKSVPQIIVETSRLAPSTPLTGRRYLAEKPPTEAFTPVTTATQSVHRLQALLCGQKVGPSDTLREMCNQCSKNPLNDILQRTRELGEKFVKEFSSTSSDEPPPVLDFSRKRLQLAESLYYKILENIMHHEKRRLQSKDPKNTDLSNVMGQDLFHRTLIACCIEIVIYSYNSQRTFPWVIETFDIDPFYFYKVIELVIRAEDGLSRDVVKHLSYIEESVLESRAWKASSPLWEAVEVWRKEHEGIVPSVEDVHFSNQIEREGMTSAPPSSFNSPLQHPAVKRIAGRTILRKDLLQSPTGPTAESFMSPISGSAKRRLFDGPPSASSTPPSTPGGSTGAPSPVKTQTITALQLTQTEDGKKVYVQMPVQLITTPTSTPKKPTSSSMVTDRETDNSSQSDGFNKETSPTESAKPKRTGSFALFLRKLYHLASVRLQDLCEKLDIDSELHRQIWTGIEYIMMNHIGLLKDRHLDQIIMCTIYVMGKVTRKERSFQDIMRCYRLQPQAQSHVYRSILLAKRRRRSSGGSESSAHSGGSDKAPKDKKISEIRSSSTLPVLPTSAPPTPTRMAGTESVFEFEDRGEQRGDLIHFYNTIFVDRIKDFSLKFAADEPTDMPILSPLPLARSQQQSPRRISTKHSVFVSAQPDTHDGSLTPTTKLLYCFNRSPATDLRAINNMLRMNEKGQQASKRLLVEEIEETETSAAKKICISSESPILHKKMRMLINDRKTLNGVDG